VAPNFNSNWGKGYISNWFDQFKYN
jgi:hypothetical protein